MINADEGELSWKTVAGWHRLTAAASKVRQLCRRSRTSSQVIIALALNIAFSQCALTETRILTKLGVIDIKTIIAEQGQLVMIQCSQFAVAIISLAISLFYSAAAWQPWSQIVVLKLEVGIHGARALASVS